MDSKAEYEFKRLVRKGIKEALDQAAAQDLELPWIGNRTAECMTEAAIANMPAKIFDRYKFRELERMVEKKRRELNVTAQECIAFAEMDVYLICLASANKAYAAATIPAQKDWAYINQLAAVLEVKRLEGADVSEGVRSILPSSMLPADAFEFGDQSL